MPDEISVPKPPAKTEKIRGFTGTGYEEIRDLYLAGVSLERIGVEFGITRERVRQICTQKLKLKARGYSQSGQYRRVQAENAVETQPLIDRYFKGESIPEIAKSVNLLPSMLYQRFKTRGVQMRSKARAERVFDELAFKAMYDRGDSFQDMAAVLGVAAMTLHKRACRRNWPLRGRGNYVRK